MVKVHISQRNDLYELPFQFLAKADDGEVVAIFVGEDGWVEMGALRAALTALEKAETRRMARFSPIEEEN